MANLPKITQTMSKLQGFTKSLSKLPEVTLDNVKTTKGYNSYVITNRNHK